MVSIPLPSGPGLRLLVSAARDSRLPRGEHREKTPDRRGSALTVTKTATRKERHRFDGHSNGGGHSICPPSEVRDNRFFAVTHSRPVACVRSHGAASCERTGQNRAKPDIFERSDDCESTPWGGHDEKASSTEFLVRAGVSRSGLPRRTSAATFRGRLPRRAGRSEGRR
jgi:hypothetical protein